MKKIFSFAKKKKNPSATPDSGSVLSFGYELKDKDLGKVHKAAAVGDLAKLKQLAKKNDLNQLDKENRTALHIACASGHAEVVQFLLESKAKLNLCDNQNRSALMKAVQCQHDRCVRVLLENHAEPNLVDINGNTALHLAANIPSISTAALLLEHEAEINAQNQEAFTPLTVAVREDHIEMAEFLLREGADVNFVDQDQRSPLMMAAGNGQISMLRLLLRFDADITLKDNKGWSADDYAVMNGHHPCSLLIIEHGTQRNNGQSLLHQGPSKKKKNTLLGHSSQNVETGFCLGGPAIDKEDIDDNSQSESLSRVSKNAAEWSSSEDDDELDLSNKKPQKVNLRKMIALKRGEASALPDKFLSGTESDPESENRVQSIPSLPKALPSSNALQHPVDPSPISFPSKAPQTTSTPLPSNRKGSSEAEDSEEEVGEEEEGEEEEEEEDDDDDDDDEVEDEDDDEEEEEEEDYEDEEDGEEDDEENECEEEEEVEEDGSCVASVKADTTELEEKPAVTSVLKIIDSADAQNIPGTDISHNSETSPGIIDETYPKTETPKNDIDRPVGTTSYALSATLGVQDDCIVSAVRVESKFSDEDDSLGSSAQNIISGMGTKEHLTLSRHHMETCSPVEVKEEEFERGMEKNDDDSGGNKQNIDDTAWNESEVEENNQIGGFDRNTVLAKQRNVLEDFVRNEDNSSDAEDDAGTNKEVLKEKRRSSWGSSLDDSDNDLREEDVVNEQTVDKEGDAQASDLHPEAAAMHSKSVLHQPSKDHLDTTWDVSSPKCVSTRPVRDEPMSSLGLCSTGTPRSKNRPATADESEWHSSSENKDQNDTGSFTEAKVVPSISQTNIVTTNHPGEQQCCDGSWEEEGRESIERESDDPSAAVSPIPEDKNITRSQSLDSDGVMDSENEKDDDSSWDDEDESDESGKQKTTAEGNVLKTLSTLTNSLSPKLRSLGAIDKKSEEEAEEYDEIEDRETVPQSIIDGNDEPPENNRPEEKKLPAVERDDPSKDDDTSEDSDSKGQKLLYDFASTTVKVSDVGDKTLDGCLCGGNKFDDEYEAKLTAYVSLENRNAAQTRVSSGHPNEEPTRERFFSSPPTKDDVAAGQCHDSVGNSSDEVLPQTDIDEFDLDSPDEAGSIGMTSKEPRNIEEPAIQTEDSTGDESDDNEEEIDEEEEGDISDENDQPEESGESLNTTSPAPETEVSKDKKRDFLSELGLEQGEEEADSWDSESCSENPKMSHEEKQSLYTQDQKEMSTVKEEIKDTGNNDNGESGDEHVDKDTIQKETEKVNWEPLSVLSKLEGEKDQKTDLMEELGLGDVDDLEDASDWDSASNTSKRTLPGPRMASPVPEEFAECSNPSAKTQDEDNVPAAPMTPQRSINSSERLPSTPPQPVPRARKMALQRPESEEESDWEPDNLTSSSTAELQAVVKPGSSEPSSVTKDSYSNEESDQQQQKEKYHAVDTCELNQNSPCPSGHVGSDSGEKDNDLRGLRSLEGGGETVDNIPWEKRYEKLWVEVEKREVKSTFKNVAGELKEKFGELFKSRCPAEGLTEEQQAMAEYASAEEESSDEEGEAIVRPMARARSTVLLTIPEQRESGPEDSVTESSDKPISQERMQVRERPSPESSMCREPDVNTLLKDDTKPGPVQKPHLDLTLKDTTANLDEAVKSYVSSEEDLEEKSASLSGRRRSASIPGVSDEELEEDMERFKLEVGKLKVVFLDLEKEKAQLQKEVCRETVTSAMEVQKSSTFWDTGGTTLEEVGAEKPDTSLGFQSRQDGAIQQEQLPVATKSINGAPAQLHLPLEQRNSNKQEEQSIQEILQLELVRGAQHSTAPQTNSHVNGDPLSVFHDSSLSDMSDNEGRLSTSGQQENKNPEEMEMAEDFDEITQSSDTATDDIDSPTSGYRHASLLIQKLDSVTLDSRSMVKLQNIFHEYERSIQKARSRYCYLTDKVSHLEMERAEIKRSLEEVKDLKSGLERDQLELQTEVTNLKFQLKQEQENRRNATMMYNTTKDKLRRMEEQQQFEVQERQKVELTLRNLELEMGALVNNMKQLEEAHNETQRLLDQERSARTLQENLLSSHLRKQQEIEEENKRNMSKSNEALSQLTEASDRERELLQQNATLQEQLTILKTDLERSQANSSLRESHLWEEKEALKEQLEDARRDLKLNIEALTQTGFNCNNQVATLKSELAMTTNRLENERQTRETVETEVESTRTRLAGAVREAELCLAARTDAERALLREKEEHQRFKDRLTGEAASQREAISNLSQKLSVAEARANSMENEVHRVTLQLTEKGLLLDVLQREKDQASARVKELEMTLQAERELGSRAGARQEATQERLAQAQSDAMLLRQQLEEAQNKGVAKERAVTDAQERFSDILTKLRSDCEERVQLMEERNKELVSKAADLRDQIYKLEEEKNERETSLRQLQQELADALKKLSMSEASLEVNTRYRNDLEEEKARLFRDLDRLKGKLEESEDQYVQAEKRINGLKSMLDDREKELTSAAQKMQEAVSASAASHTTIKQLEEAVQRLEIENARLEAAAKQQSHKIDALQKGAQEAVMVRGHLEDLVTNLQSSKMTLEDQLSREVQKQSTLTHTAQDSQALWEEELKSRSKLGLRLAELEKEKGELSTQVEIEKKKAKKVSEQKKAVDTRLDEEMKRNTELQKEMYRLRTLLKTAKKKLREQDIGGTAFGSPMSSLRMDQGRPSQAEGGFGRMKDKVEDLRMQLEKESSHRCQVEKANGDLKDQLASLRSLSRNNDELERSKRKLEEEVLDLRRRMEACQMEQTQLELYRRDIEERARQDVQQKLDQVNLFMQSQAESQEALDRMREANENSLRSQLQQKIKEIEGELDRARTIQQDSLNQRESTRIELEQYQQLYREELRLRKSLDAKLERANCRLAEANSKLLSERSRSLISNGIGSLGGPALDVGSLGSSAHHGATLGPLTRSLGLGNSLLNPLPEGQSSGAEDYLTKLRRELDRSITHELTHAQAELDIASARLSPVGSASWVELDPVSRARQEYLEVLKRNHEI